MFPACSPPCCLLVSLVGLTADPSLPGADRAQAQCEATSLREQATRDAEGLLCRSPCPGRGQVCRIGNAWKSYALGYEVFCEATYEGDDRGVLNAGTEIAAARSNLQALGQYDA